VRTKNCKSTKHSVEDEFRKVKQVAGKKIEKPFRVIKKEIECELVSSEPNKSAAKTTQIKKIKKNNNDGTTSKYLTKKAKDNKHYPAGHEEMISFAHDPIKEAATLKKKSVLRIIIGSKKNQFTK